MFEPLRKLKEQDKNETELEWLEYLMKRNDYLQTFGSSSGKKVLRGLLEKTFLFTTTINPKPDAMTYVREAQRNVSLEIISHIPGIAAQVIADWLLDMEQDILSRTKFGGSDE